MHMLVLHSVIKETCDTVFLLVNWSKLILTAKLGVIMTVKDFLKRLFRG